MQSFVVLPKSLEELCHKRGLLIPLNRIDIRTNVHLSKNKNIFQLLSGCQFVDVMLHIYLH